jgi:hypothetical protein
MALPYLRLGDALRAFTKAKKTTSQEHIRPLHRHIALRLVLEGGFFPDEVTPHPPLRAVGEATPFALKHDPDAETPSELTVFGGMKTKKVDVVVAKPGVGPVLAVSVKGTLGAYRNLVNRMEEAIGDSTNLHVMYPGLVYGFLHVVKANREEDGYGPRDMGVTERGQVSPLILRYHAALCEMAGRRFVRNDFTRYEAVALAMVEGRDAIAGTVRADFPAPDSTLRIERFFRVLFETYDLRYPLRAGHVAIAQRTEWAPDSPLLKQIMTGSRKSLRDLLGYEPRLSA